MIMWVEKRQNGNYKFTERYTDIYTGKERKVSVTLKKNNAQTRKLAEKLLQDKVDDALGKTKEVVRLSDLVEDYLKYQEKAVKQSTYERNKGFCKTIEKLLGKDLLVNNLTAKYVKTRLLSTGKGAGTLNEIITRFRALVRWGYKNDYIEDIRFLDKLEMFKDNTHREKIKDKFLESDELQKLLDSMPIEKWKLVTHFLALSGLRVGELMSLTKEDIDISERLIHINKTYNPNCYTTTVPKTLSSNRDIYIQDELLPVIRQINKLRNQLQLLGELQRNDLFVPGRNTTHMEYDSYRQYLHDKSLKVLERKITPHTLRHTHASLLMEQGVPIETISRRLGHENSKVTMEIYLHVTEKLKEKDYAQVEKIKLLS